MNTVTCDHPELRTYARGLCRACYQREWRQRNPAACSAAQRRWAEKHPEKIAAARARYSAELAATHDERVAANRERARQRAAAALADRFWSKVDQTGTCWTWTASTDEFGYGRIGIGRQRIEHAHRIAWTLAYGPIPEGLYVLHHCDNPPCVRPDHLFVGTQRDNSRDMIAKGRGRGQLRPVNAA